MLYIKTSLADESFNGVFQWHVGEKCPIYQKELLSESYYFPKCVKEVQADCDELSFILHNVLGIPRSYSRVQRWFGNDARFIVAFIGSYVHAPIFPLPVLGVES